MQLGSLMTGTELAALTSLLRAERLSGRHLEIGTAAGGTLKEMMLAYPGEKRPSFSVVDTLRFFPGQRETIEATLRGGGIDPTSVDFRVGKSWDLLQAAKGERFSFILIDANHKAPHVMQDLCWAEMLDVGGLLCLHDFAANHPGVVWAASRFMRRNPSTFSVVTQADSLLILRRVAPGGGAVSPLDLGLAGLVGLMHAGRSGLRKRFASRAAAAPEGR